MADPASRRAEIERDFRGLLRDGDLPEPDGVLPHEDGGILCLWHESKLAVVIDPDDAEPRGR